MNAYLNEFMERFDYPAESRPVLRQALDQILSNEQTGTAFAAMLQAYAENKNQDFARMTLDVAALSRQAGANVYAGQLVLFICLSKQLQVYYRQYKIPESVWEESMKDLRYKLYECKAVYGQWGTFVDWFGGFYNLTRFALGRLQFDLTKVGHAYEKDGVVLTPDSKALNVHIPRTGTRLDRESVRNTFDEAARFFRDWFAGEPVVFICESWLLFPRHREMLPASSNIVGFMDFFDIVETELFDDYWEVWRLFDCNYNPDLDQMPQDSSLRRSYVDLMRRGEKTGGGFGIRIHNT